MRTLTPLTRTMNRPHAPRIDPTRKSGCLENLREFPTHRQVRSPAGRSGKDASRIYESSRHTPPHSQPHVPKGSEAVATVTTARPLEDGGHASRPPTCP